MEGREDHLERRFAGKLWMLIDRNAAAVVGDRQAIAFIERHFDALGMARDGFVHRIVEHLGGQMVKRALVHPTDVHAGTPSDRLEPFEDLDRAGIVVSAASGQLVEQVVGHGAAIRRGFAGVQARSERLSAVRVPAPVPKDAKAHAAATGVPANFPRTPQNRVGAGSTTVTLPLPIWRTSIARWPTPLL